MSKTVLKLTKLFFLISGLSFGVSFPMATAGKYVTKQTAKKGFSHVASACHWGITTLPWLWDSYKKTKEHFDGSIEQGLQILPDAPDVLQEFVRQELKSGGLAHYDTLAIKVGWWPGSDIIDLKNGGYAACSNKAIYIRPYTAQAVLVALRYPSDARSIDMLNRARFIIGHERTHLEKNDTLTRAIITGVMPLAVHAATKGLVSCKNILSILLGLSKKITDPYSVKKSLLKIPSAALKNGATFIGMRQVEQFHELRADAQATNDPVILNAGIESLKVMATLEALDELAFVQAFSKAPIFDADKSRLISRHKRILRRLFATHPACSDRIAELEKRL